MRDDSGREPEDSLLHRPQSRRSFLKSVGVAGAAAAVLPTSALAQDGGAKSAKPSGPAGLRVVGRGASEFTLSINGVDTKVKAEPRATLLDVLRDDLGMTGSKEVCDRGACGACSVLVDGKAVNACMMLAIEGTGHRIETIEGIAADPANAALIDSFCEHDGAQCGFCIPGFVVRSKALLAENPNPTMDEIKSGLSGNLCRCGTYQKIFESVQGAAKGGAK